MAIDVSKSKCLVIGNRTKLSRIDYEHKLRVHNVPLDYVQKYCYLGVCLDSEMSLSPLLSHVKKVVSSKAKTLMNIRKYINTTCALSIYKQTMLPLFDYSGFLLISCIKSDRRDLQTMENNILRSCFNVQLLDRLSLVDMHQEASLVSLEQRREIQTLSLMYIYKRFANVEHIFAKNTRQGDRYNFHVENYQSSKYRNSPYHKGSILWDNLPLDVINAPTLDEIKA